MKFRIRWTLLLTLILAAPKVTAVEAVNTSFLSNTAIRGYDAVAYFVDGAAYKGSKEFEYEWNGAKWLFVSEENMSKFKLAPESYAPQFGGYCSYAVGLGDTATADPLQFSIVDDKLYLNYSSKTKVLWEDDRDKFIENGHKNWPNLVDQ